jgi:SAM-dependent methyltransferase
MSLAYASVPGGVTPPLHGEAPYPGDALLDWAGAAFELPPGDPRLREIHDGGPAPSPPLDNLVGMVAAWEDHPEWLDFLDPGAPNYEDKQLERDLYRRWWEAHVPEGCRALDLGGGVGRFSTWLMDRGCAVELVDPDLRSLWRALQHCAGRRGRLDLHWSTGEALPALPPVDVAIAAEVLCYSEDPAAALARVREALVPGGALLCSVEARWGWAAALDVAPGTLPALLSDGVVHVPGDRWIRTFTGEDFQSLLEGAGFTVERLVPTHYVPSGPFEAAAGSLDLDGIMALEARLRADPVTAPLNRAWLAVARR